MGDEVKITVIATGFRKEMPERRDRMLNAALRQPIIPRVQMSSPVVTPRFASEEENEPIYVSSGAREHSNGAEAAFDVSADHEPVYTPTHANGNAAMDGFAQSAEAPAQAEPVAVAVAEHSGDAEIFAEPDHDEHGENLDIPAFLRRGGL
jgi:cell division protein FtsZ